VEDTSHWEVAAGCGGKLQGWAGVLLRDKNQPGGDQHHPLPSSQPTGTQGPRGQETEQLGKGRGGSGASSPAPFCGSFQQSQGQSAAYF